MPKNSLLNLSKNIQLVRCESRFIGRESNFSAPAQKPLCCLAVSSKDFLFSASLSQLEIPYKFKEYIFEMDIFSHLEKKNYLRREIKVWCGWVSGTGREGSKIPLEILKQSSSSLC